VAVVIGVVQHRYMAGAAVAITLLFLPLGVLSVAAWVGLWVPYRPQKLLWRWQHRSDWRAALLRWGLLVLLPYLVVPLIAILLLVPSLIIWILARRGYPPGEMALDDLWLGTAVSVIGELTWPRYAATTEQNHPPRVRRCAASPRMLSDGSPLSDPSGKFHKQRG
jgi:hypothetical protein